MYRKQISKRSRMRSAHLATVRCFFSIWGRVWVHHLSLSSGHHWNSDGWWLSCPIPWSIKTVYSVYPEFIMIHSFTFIYICQQIEKTGSFTTGMAIGGGGHRPSLFWRWPELKLRWWTQTLPRLYRIHDRTWWPPPGVSGVGPTALDIPTPRHSYPLWKGTGTRDIYRSPGKGMGPGILAHFPCGRNDWQTPVKTLPFRNFIGARQVSTLTWSSPMPTQFLDPPR